MIINFDSLSVFIVSSFSCVFPYILLLILLYCLPSLQWSLGWLVLLYFPCIFRGKKKKQQQTNGKIVFMMIVIIAGLLKCIASTLFSGILISGAVLVYFFFHSRQEWEREEWSQQIIHRYSSIAKTSLEKKNAYMLKPMFATSVINDHGSRSMLYFSCQSLAVTQESW